MRATHDQAGTASDVVTKAVTRHRSKVETLTLIEHLGRRLTSHRGITEALTTADATARGFHAIRRFIETLPTTDHPTRVLTEHRSLVETYRTRDTTFGGWGTRRTISDSIAGIVDHLGVAAKHPRSIVETLHTSDSVLAQHVFMAIMGWLWADSSGNAVADLPNWGYVLSEGTTNVLGAERLPVRQPDFTRDK